MVIHAGSVVEFAWWNTARRVNHWRWGSKTLGHGGANGSRSVGSGVCGDQQILESTLKFCNGGESLLSVFNSWWLSRCRSCRFDKGLGNRLPLNNGADRSGLLLLVFDGSWLWCNRFLLVDGDLESKLQLGLCSSIELLVDGGVVRVKNDEGGGTVGIALEDSLSRWRDGE